MQHHNVNSHELGYTQQWLDYGIITEPQLQEQLATIAEGEDPHTEHYRYRTLSNYIVKRQEINNDELHGLLQVIMNDPDPAMAGSAAILLLKRQYLNEVQFEELTKCLLHFGDWTQKEIERQRLKRADL